MIHQAEATLSPTGNKALLDQLDQAVDAVLHAMDGLDENYRKGWNTRSARECLRERNLKLKGLLHELRKSA